MTNTYVLYHASCPDGFGAAFAAWHRLGDSAVYLPVQYGEPIPAIPDGSTVYILDFSYDRATLTALNGRVAKLVVLDHHATAQAELAGLPFATFDMEKSGAVLAWEHFHPGEPVPMLLQYVQSRDLWRWELPASREVNAVLALQPRDFATWDGIASLLDYPAAIADWKEHGRLILDYQAHQVASLCAEAHWAAIGGHRVPAVNSPVWQSEIGEELCKRHPDAPFAAVFFVLPTGEFVYSLRSRGGFDVSAVAKTLGGGGHRAAAGFRSRVLLTGD